MSGPKPRPIADRFWEKVTKSDGCWPWRGSKNPYGYGRISTGDKNKMMPAHRLSYEIANGPITAGLQIDHMCHNKSCVNPDHLRMVTPKQNQENRTGLRSTNTSGVHGVSWTKKTQSWLAKVTHKGETYRLGHFSDIKEAETAVVAKRNELYTHNNLDRLES